MIKTILLEPELFNNILKVTGTKIIEEEVQVKIKGLFGRTTIETRKENKEKQVFGLDEEILSKYPQDVVEQIKKGGHTSEGYFQFVGFRFHSVATPFKEFKRGFAYTLTDFYNKNKITQDNLISLEYCKKEGKDSCDITGAYVTWENE